MNEKSLLRGQKIMSDLARIKNNLDELRAKDFEGVTFYDEGLSQKTKDEIRRTLIRSHINKRRSLQRQFKKL